jgi:sterol desaturase/sphingolipid hydroxylase (fatty acid hydroxylase superfamily)
MHELHHRLPKDWIGAASWTTFAGFALVWSIAVYGLDDGALASAFLGGFMLGYLAYCAIHVRMHHGRVDRFSRYLAFMHRHHVGHHRGGRGNFGVSSPVWDVVFNSYQKGKGSC